MKTVNALFRPSPAFNLDFMVVVHPTQASLEAAFAGADRSKSTEFTYAFCTSGDARVGIAAVLHFTRERFDRRAIAHEAYHAVLFLKNALRMDEKYIVAEELLAEAMENTVEECFSLKSKISKNATPTR